MKQIMTHDCRTINNGTKCKHLRPHKGTRLTLAPRFYICRDSNNILWPLIDNQGKIKEKVKGISPIYSCSIMGELRAKGLAQEAEFTIFPDGTSSHWNKEL